MGVDVWVRRPGGPLAAGLWVDRAVEQSDAGAAAAVVDEADGGVPPVAHVSAVAVEGASESLGAAPGPGRAVPEPMRVVSAPAVISRAPQVPFEPLSEDVAARWDTLRTEILACTKCGLHKTRTQGVVGVGPRRSDWMVIGEAPGAEEDRRGEPFVGRAGHLLDAMLHAIGLNRGTNVYIANVLKSRPPGNRDPKPDEVAACLPYLMRQIALLQPRVMLAVGRIAAQNLLSTDLSLGRLRGKVHHFGDLNTPLIVTYHPAYLLRTPADKSKAWEDLKFARSVFRQLTGGVGTDGNLS